jgi:MoxR-like ATPase
LLRPREIQQPNSMMLLKARVSFRRIAVWLLTIVLMNIGKGMVVLLEGPPGLGKTLTVESCRLPPIS